MTADDLIDGFGSFKAKPESALAVNEPVQAEVEASISDNILAAAPPPAVQVDVPKRKSTKKKKKVIRKKKNNDGDIEIDVDLDVEENYEAQIKEIDDMSDE